MPAGGRRRCCGTSPADWPRSARVTKPTHAPGTRRRSTRSSTSGECCAVSDDGKVDVEQAAFILEGIRDGLDNADLDEGSDFVQRDIERLNDVVFRYNSAAGKAVG